MPNRALNPSGVAAPLGTYSHAIEVPPNARWLYISGQVGMAADGTVGETFARQAELAWQNILSVLAAAGMGPADLVDVTTYLTRTEDLPESRLARAQALGDARPASTLVVISALAAPRFLIEIEARAAKS